jgi:3-hydroxyisobutyrate dehydrogenase
MKETIGFIGLGALGSVVAARLAGAGHPLLIWNRSPEKAEPLGEFASSPAEVVTRSQKVVLCLRDSEAVWAVTSGSSGIFAGEVAGRTIVDLSTNHVELATVLHGLAAKARLVSGGAGARQPDPAAGGLTVLVSGRESRGAAAAGDHRQRLFFLGAPGRATR